MCGIAGIYHRTLEKSVDLPVLSRMRDVIAYRGPDSAGAFVSGPIGLGIRRLAIIDITGGTQPMQSPDGRYTIVFNGEIYNYRELRARYRERYAFRTQSDTEVFLAHVIHAGPEGLRDLNGMFACAIWDREREELFLARDRFGKKPLYYADLGELFLFGSEPKSLLEHSSLSRDLDPVAITQYFLHEYMPSPRTPFARMRKLPPGHWLRVTRATLTLRRWWQLPPAPVPPSRAHPEQRVRHFDDVFRSAVTARMVADVPVGVLLSGGIDSTTIAWYMRQQTKELHSFSASFQEATFDESRYALLAAQKIGTHHHDVPFTLDRFHETLALVKERLDEPLADASLLPTLAVSQEAKKWVTVVLDGDGADELFLSYNTFPAYQLSLLAERLPRFLRTALTRSVVSLPTRHTNFSTDFMLKSFVRGLPFRGAVRNQVWLGSFHDQELRRLLHPAWQDAVAKIYDPVTALEETFSARSPLERLSLIYLSQYLSEDILVKIDRATMYASVEGRTPFLDPALVAFVLGLPLHERYRMFRGKQLLARMMRGRIPKAIINRPKKGFGIPLGAWLRGPLRPLLVETLAPDRTAATGILEPSPVRRLVSEHLDGQADHRKKLWTLMVFLWWWERWAR